MMMANATLKTIADALKDDAIHAGMSRMRGGLSKGTAWLEISGRGNDGAWYEGRFHALQDGRLMGGMLAYHPLARGGRTLTIGEQSYDTTDDTSTQHMIDEARTWLERIARTRYP